MAITSNLLTSDGDNDNLTVYTTISVAPASNELLLLAVISAKSGGGEVPDSVTGNGLTWVQIATVLNNKRVTLYRAMGASPSSGVLTITFPSEQTGCMWNLSEYGTDIDTTGSNGSGATGSDANIVTNTADSVTALTVTLAAFSDAGNATFGAFGTPAQATFTEGTGFTLIAKKNQSAPGISNISEFRNDNDTSVDVTIDTTTDLAGIAVELFAASAAAVPGEDDDFLLPVVAPTPDQVAVYS